MASLPFSAEAEGFSPATPRQIPLECCVCPETPRFSDVSHLLTHISSKGHLHHEAQTRLKSYEDDDSSLTMQRYERWYTDYDIEALLLGRLKAKQGKEAAKNKRGRGASAGPASKVRRHTSLGSPFSLHLLSNALYIRQRRRRSELRTRIPMPRGRIRMMSPPSSPCIPEFSRPITAPRSRKTYLRRRT